MRSPRTSRRGARVAGGYTLYELMISLIMIGILAGLCATIAASARQDERTAGAYAEDLRHLRTASERLTAAVRGARHVAATDAGILIDGTFWQADDGALLRGDAVAVRGVSRLCAEALGQRRFRIAVTPVPRRAGATPPELVTTTRQRAEGAR